MSLQADQLEAFDALLDVMHEADPDGCVIRWPVTKAGADATGAADYDAIPSLSPDMLNLVEGGFREEYGYSVSARKDDFDTLPGNGTLVLRNGKVSRIINVESGETSAIVLIHCTTPEK